MSHSLITMNTWPHRRHHNPLYKTILTWNDLFGAPHFNAQLGNATFLECPVKSCELWDRLDSEPDLPHDRYDAIVFHAIDTASVPTDLRPPKVRSRAQRYVFVLQESPAMRPHIYNVGDFFNWTATYRLDSDIAIPLSDIRASDHNNGSIGDDGYDARGWMKPVFEHSISLPAFVSGKTRPVVWFVSNSDTQSKRDKYVDELSRHIDVDVFGLGRKLSCDRDRDCDSMLDTTYKFYLAFENSLCRDYVTEKFTRAMVRYVVPVVYGGVDYRLFAPPHSYIDARDYASPRELARYLHHLDSNPLEYAKYFWWKNHYRQKGGIMWCDLCAKLNDPDEPERVYPDMGRWWNHQGVCESPEDYFARAFYRLIYTVYPHTEPWWRENGVCPSP